MRRLAAAAHARWRAFAGAADDVRASSIAIWSTIRERAARDDRPMSALPRLARPLAGEVTSVFGMRGGRLHEGIDVAQPEGTPVRAALGGAVLLAGELPGYGNLVVLDHGGNLVTVYAHLATVDVARDARIAPGQQVGTVGATGHSFGAHLHFEVRFEGTAVDPAVFLDPS
jgi:murein DD-endopeptidase MepM/ murein hydrolase activator NlpD